MKKIKSVLFILSCLITGVTSSFADGLMQEKEMGIYISTMRNILKSINKDSSVTVQSLRPLRYRTPKYIFIRVHQSSEGIIIDEFYTPFGRVIPNGNFKLSDLPQSISYKYVTEQTDVFDCYLLLGRGDIYRFSEIYKKPTELVVITHTDSTDFQVPNERLFIYSRVIIAPKLIQLAQSIQFSHEEGYFPEPSDPYSR
ncbi:MAG: hypothetical protein A2007_02580 [Verrucomicrobia bacterium GWC2_42_7]|nr:MAG: hypothetical protein A2007_02580 [Verrucomicrobia bacterium GWC2_42_7]